MISYQAWNPIFALLSLVSILKNRHLTSLLFAFITSFIHGHGFIILFICLILLLHKKIFIKEKIKHRYFISFAITLIGVMVYQSYYKNGIQIPMDVVIQEFLKNPISLLTYLLKCISSSIYLPETFLFLLFRYFLGFILIFTHLSLYIKNIKRPPQVWAYFGLYILISLTLVSIFRFCIPFETANRYEFLSSYYLISILVLLFNSSFKKLKIATTAILILLLLLYSFRIQVNFNNADLRSRLSTKVLPNFFIYNYPLFKINYFNEYNKDFTLEYDKIKHKNCEIFKKAFSENLINFNVNSLNQKVNINNRLKIRQKKKYNSISIENLDHRLLIISNLDKKPFNLIIDDGYDYYHYESYFYDKKSKTCILDIENIETENFEIFIEIKKSHFISFLQNPTK